MRKEARILYIYDSEIESSRVLAEQLRSGLTGWDITITDAKFTTLLFEARKYNVVHLFLPLASSKASQFVRKLAGKTKVVQTAIAVPQLEDFNKNFGLERLIVFCESDHQRILELHPEMQVEVIPPTVILPDVNHLQHSGEIKNKFEVGERLLAVALNDVSTRQHFDSFLYVIREFNRRGEFRLIVPRFKTNLETLKWRKELQNQIDNERLHSTTLLQEDSNLHSLIDSADFTIHLRKDRDQYFDFPLSIVESCLIGKPVLCFNIPPFNEFISRFHKNWAFNNIEEMINEARDLQRTAINLEQLSTELARYARTTLSLDRIASMYRKVYEGIFERQGAKVS
jgi:glycosyltransferase involved in cell wall biosynthesis